MPAKTGNLILGLVTTISSSGDIDIYLLVIAENPLIDMVYAFVECVFNCINSTDYYNAAF